MNRQQKLVMLSNHKRVVKYADFMIENAKEAPEFKGQTPTLEQAKKSVLEGCLTRGEYESRLTYDSVDISLVREILLRRMGLTKPVLVGGMNLPPPAMIPSVIRQGLPFV